MTRRGPPARPFGHLWRNRSEPRQNPTHALPHARTTDGRSEEECPMKYKVLIGSTAASCAMLTSLAGGGLLAPASASGATKPPPAPKAAPKAPHDAVSSTEWGDVDPAEAAATLTSNGVWSPV